MKDTTKKILKSAANLRTYPGTKRLRDSEWTGDSAKRKTAAMVLKELSKKDRRKIYLHTFKPSHPNHYIQRKPNDGLGNYA